MNAATAMLLFIGVSLPPLHPNLLATNDLQVRCARCVRGTLAEAPAAQQPTWPLRVDSFPKLDSTRRVQLPGGRLLYRANITPRFKDTVSESARSRFTIAGTDSSLVVGDLVSMIGSGTRWSQAYVQKTGTNVKVSTGPVAECQDLVHYGNGAGDGSGPIHLNISASDSNVVLGGLHWSKTGQYPVFSPWLPSDTPPQRRRVPPRTRCRHGFPRRRTLPATLVHHTTTPLT